MKPQVTQVLRRHMYVAVMVAALVVVGGGFAYASIPGPDGVISGCRNKSTGVLRVIDRDAGVRCRASERALDWNQVGPQGPPGQEGAQGAAGVQGPPGIVNAIFAGSRTHVDLVPSPTQILAVDLPAGAWYVQGIVGLGNFSGQRVPVLCAVGSTGGSYTTTSITALAPYPGTGGDAVSLPVSAVFTLDQPGRAWIECMSNTGNPGVTAFAEGRQMTAVSLANVTVQQNPDA